MVVVRVKFNGAEEFGNVELLAVTDELFQRGVDGLALGAKTANALGLDEELVVDVEVRSHCSTQYVTQMIV